MIGNKIKQFRQELGWSQERLAKQCGINQSTIHRIEAGAENPKLESVEKIASGLGISLDELVGRGERLGQ